MIGKKVGKLTVIAKGKSISKCATWLCRCDCGKEVTVRSHHLGSTKSCGCLKKSLMQGSSIVCKICGIPKSVSEFYIKDGRKTRHNTCKECSRPILAARKKERTQRDRLAALRAYSDGKICCRCCGEVHIEFLTIDHIDGGGTKHRREVGEGSGTFFRWLRNHGYPSGYRVLCVNCNWSRGLYGYCPHEKGGIA